MRIRSRLPLALLAALAVAVVASLASCAAEPDVGAGPPGSGSAAGGSPGSGAVGGPAGGTAGGGADGALGAAAGDTIQPGWSPDHLSADGRTITIAVQQPCDGELGEPEVTLDERPAEVVLRVEAVVIVPSRGLECGAPPALVDVALTEPLGDRLLVDTVDPQRDLPWTVAPGSVRATVRLVLEPGAIADAIDDELYVGLGIDTPMVPVPVAELRGGDPFLLPVVLEPGPHVGIVGVLDELPLVPGAMRGEVRAPIPEWQPGPADQVLVVTVGAGALTGSGRDVVVDPTRITATWELPGS